MNKTPVCPRCDSTRICRDGLRYLTNGGNIQRWLCRECYYRYSEGQNSKTSKKKIVKQRVSVSRQESKNLLKAIALFKTHNKKEIDKGLAGATNNSIIYTREKEEIFKIAWHLNKQGYMKTTIKLTSSCLHTLQSRGANLRDPESVKTVIAKQKWSGNRRRNVINAYNHYVKYHGLTWIKPKNKITQKIPFIPTEKEIDNLIAGSSKKLATFLQLLKETAMRAGEARQMKWLDINFEKNIITLNDPEKGSNPRIWKVKNKLIAMINNLPRKNQYIFGNNNPGALKSTHLKTRKRLTHNLQNPRLTKISFHTIRHWKATDLYHKTHDIYYVKRFLGHKSLRNTEIYINIEQAIFDPTSDEFTVKATDNPKEIKSLLEVGFEYILQKDNLTFLRKRK